MDIHFGCTACGNCCRNLKLPLTVAEALTWLERSHEVQVICEAAPAAGDEDGAAAHFRRRSFTSMSGTMPVQVAVILAANLEGSCPNLQADMRCGIYDRRPLVCRIYPAEINPFIRLEPAAKACPPQAWSDGGALFQRNGQPVDAVLRDDIQASRDAGALDAGVKQRVCSELRICDTARAGEGFMIHSPAGAALRAALMRAIDTDQDGTATPANWRFVSDRRGSVRELSERGGCAVPSIEAGACGQAPDPQYIGFGTAGV